MVNLKSGQDEEERAFLDSPGRDHVQDKPSRRGSKRPATFYLRLLLELGMAVAIVVLLTRPFSESCRRLKSSPVPRFPRKTYIFAENKTYLHEDMFASREATLHTLHKWIGLSAAARGYIHIPDWSSYDIGEPHTLGIDREHDGPAYMMSVFHQLHCLSYIVEHFQSGYGGVKLDQEVAHHSAHCFDYLRQSIMCAGDTNLEGKTAAGPGWGSEHECVDYDALLQWANKHGTMPWRGALLPDEAVL